MKITYYGHSCFVIESNGYSIALDPYDGVPGYRPLAIQTNEVLCSHEHGDHGFRAAVNIIPSVCPNPFRITEINSFHDSQRGALRGSNIIRIFEAEGLRIAHLGDIGCVPEKNQLKQLIGLDLVMAPVGGVFTLDAKEQKDLLDTIGPKLIIPMHYQSYGRGYDVLGTVFEFTSLYDNQDNMPVHFSDGNSLELVSGFVPDSGVYVLQYI